MSDSRVGYVKTIKRYALNIGPIVNYTSELTMANPREMELTPDAINAFLDKEGTNTNLPCFVTVLFFDLEDEWDRYEEELGEWLCSSDRNDEYKPEEPSEFSFLSGVPLAAR